MNLLAYPRPVFNISVTFPKQKKKNPQKIGDERRGEGEGGVRASVDTWVSERKMQGEKKDSSSRTRQDSESIKSDPFHLVSQHIFHLLLVFICFFFFFCSVVTLWRRVVYTFSLFPSFSSWLLASRKTRNKQQQKKKRKDRYNMLQGPFKLYTHTLW